MVKYKVVMSQTGNYFYPQYKEDCEVHYTFYTDSNGFPIAYNSAAEAIQFCQNEESKNGKFQTVWEWTP